MVGFTNAPAARCVVRTETVKVLLKGMVEPERGNAIMAEIMLDVEGI